MVARAIRRPISPTILRTSSPQMKRNQKQRRSNKKLVKFGSVEVRSYARTIGDSPACYGPPLSLETKTASQVRFKTMAEYEKTTKSSHDKTKTTSYYPLTPDQRFLMLKEWGISDSQIKLVLADIKTLQDDFSASKPISPCWKLEQRLLKMGLIKSSENKLVTKVMQGGKSTEVAAVKTTAATTTKKQAKAPMTPTVKKPIVAKRLGLLKSVQNKRERGRRNQVHEIDC